MRCEQPQEQQEKSKEISSGKRSIFGTGSAACLTAHITLCCAMASLVGYILMETASQIGQETPHPSNLAALVICCCGTHFATSLHVILIQS